MGLAHLARPNRLERLTHSLEGCCSVQLSYGRSAINIDFPFLFFKRKEILFFFMKAFIEPFSHFFGQELAQFLFGGL